MLTPKTSTPLPRGGGLNFGIDSGQLMTFPRLDFFTHWGGSNFFGLKLFRINPHNWRAKFGCSQTVVSEKKGIQDRDTHTHKGTLQLYKKSYSRLPTLYYLNVFVLIHNCIV